MSNEPNPNDIRNVWQKQEVDRVTIAIDDLRRRALRFERRVHWRNVREYVAGAVVCVFFAAMLAHAHGWQITAPALLIAGVAYILFQLHQRGSARSLPAQAGIMATLEFHRRELERQRDALKSVWRWYLLPIAPGCIASALVTAIDRGVDFRLWIGVGIMVSIFYFVWRLNAAAARRLEGKIEELKAMESSNE